MLDLTLDKVDCQPGTFGRFPLARPIATHLRQNDLSVPPTRYLPVSTSQILTVLSPLTEAKVLPSGLNATE